MRTRLNGLSERRIWLDVPSGRPSVMYGFTIVELLVVIVVIAILAAVTVMAYNGVRDRATDAQKAAIADSVQKSLENFYTLNSRYPASDEMQSEPDLLQLGLHQTDVVPAGCQVSKGIPLGNPATSTTCGFTYLAHPNPNGSGFQCNKPTVCHSYTLSYWSMSQGKAITVRHGQ